MGLAHCCVELATRLARSRIGSKTVRQGIQVRRESILVGIRPRKLAVDQDDNLVDIVNIAAIEFCRVHDSLRCSNSFANLVYGGVFHCSISVVARKIY
jgi:hypothetical protein